MGKKPIVLLLSLLAFVLEANSTIVAAIDAQNDVADSPMSAEDIPEYEVLHFPSKYEVLVMTHRSNKQQTATQQTTTKKPSTQQQQQNSACTCKYGQCTCCTGPVLALIQQKACMKIVYSPEDFAFDFSMMLNNRVMYQNKVSGKNPPPACVSLPRFNSLRMCAKFSNIYFAGRNLHVCLGMEGKWDSFQLFSFSFDCLRMGSEGVFFLKPEDGGYPVGVNGGTDAIIDAGGDDIEDYDENVVRSAKAEIQSLIRNNVTLRSYHVH